MECVTMMRNRKPFPSLVAASVVALLALLSLHALSATVEAHSSIDAWGGLPMGLAGDGAVTVPDNNADLVLRSGIAPGYSSVMFEEGHVRAGYGVPAEAALSALQSDDFNTCHLDTDLWTFTDPVGNATLAMSGTHALISVPAGTEHDIWGTGPADFANDSARIMQLAGSTKFTIEVKFDSGLSQRYQTQGVLIEEDADDLLRFEFHGDGSNTKIFAAKIQDGVASNVGGWGSNITTGGVAPLYMRVEREDDEWTQSYSFDTVSWSTYVTFTHAMTVTAVGVYAGNSADTPGNEPAHTALVDYFFDADAPIVPEDAEANTVTVHEVGGGTVTKDPDRTAYTCSEVVTLTATADPHWTFANWSGDLLGSSNPQTLTITGDHVVTATFSQLDYTLTVNHLGNGSVAVDPSPGPYHYGDVVTLTATGDPGWGFDHWSGALSGTTNPATTTITGHTTVTATFAMEEYTLTVNRVGNGSVAVDPSPGPYYYGDVVTLTATADPHWTFANWSGALSGAANPATTTITGHTAVTATFNQVDYTLTVNRVGNGSVAVDPSPGPFHYGDVVTLTATGDPGWDFDRWSGALSGTTNPATITIMGHTTVTATFSQIDYTLTVNRVGDGSVAVDPSPGPYHYGDVVTLTATGDPGWGLDHWSGALSGATNPATTTIMGHTTVTATFALEEYTLTVNRVGDGSVAVDPSPGPYYYGDVVTLTATADPHWTFDHWSGGLSGATNPATTTITSHTTVTAIFSQVDYTLTVNHLGNGSVAVDPSPGPYHYGDVITLTAIGDPGWGFDHWSGALSGTTNPATTTITGHTTVTATFVMEEYVLTVNRVGDGSVAVDPSPGPYYYGDVVTLTATADPHWTFDHWSGGLSGADNPASLTITDNTIVTATFAWEEHTLTVNVIGGGSVERDPDRSTYPYGTVVTLTAKADPAWTFSGWSGDLSGAENPELVTITGNATVTATFTAYQVFLPLIGVQYSP
jgi:regulation of enolase protein 1 (concanavalin A-like superfamily)